MWKAVLCVWIVLAGTGVPAQEPDSVAMELAKLMDKADQLIYSDFRTSDSLYQVVEDRLFRVGTTNYPMERVSVSNRRALGCFYNQRFEQSRAHVMRARAHLDHFRDHFTARQRDSLVHSLKFAEALYQNGVGRYDDALANLEQIHAYTARAGATPDHCRILFRVMQYQAAIYNVKGEYASAINAFLASKVYYDCYRDNSRCANYVLMYRNVGTSYLALGDYTNARRYFWKAKANVRACVAARDVTAALGTHALVLYQSLAETYVSDNPDSARYYLAQAMPFINNNPVFYERVFGSLGKVALAQGRLEEAATLFRNTRKVLLSDAPENVKALAELDYRLSEYFERRGRIDSALWYLQRAIGTVVAGGKVPPGQLRVNPRPDQVMFRRDMVRLLDRKAKLLSQVAPGSDTLGWALETARLAVALIDSTRKEATLDKDKVVFAGEASDVYETTIDITARLYARTGDRAYLDACFSLIDKAKGAVLLDQVRMIRHFSGIPKDVMETEQEVRAELSAAEQALFEAGARKQDDGPQRMALAATKKKYATFYAQLKKDHPAYYRLRTGGVPVLPDEIQHHVLTGSQALVTYFVGQHQLYIALVTRDTARLFTLPVESLLTTLETFRVHLLDPAGAGAPDEARFLEERLIAPWRRHLPDEVRSLIVVPHGQLATLPLEVLRWNEKTTMLERFSVSYAASASLLNEHTQMEGQGRDVAGFNATYGKHPSLSDLPGSLSELKAIEKEAGSVDLFVGAHADDFRIHAPAYKVIHLALHSLINDEQPLFSKLVFSATDSGTTEITANELYGMRLGAELVVLSACETGVGKLNRGEGMMSLSRAFMYAGVPTTVMTLWKVPDQATARLMERFYRHLFNGEPVADALAKAKREFVRDYPEMRTPYYWAGFIVNGKSAEVALRPSRWLWLAGIAVPVLGVLGFFVVRRLRRRHVGVLLES